MSPQMPSFVSFWCGDRGKRGITNHSLALGLPFDCHSISRMCVARERTPVHKCRVRRQSSPPSLAMRHEDPSRGLARGSPGEDFADQTVNGLHDDDDGRRCECVFLLLFVCDELSSFNKKKSEEQEHENIRCCCQQKTAHQLEYQSLYTEKLLVTGKQAELFFSLAQAEDQERLWITRLFRLKERSLSVRLLSDEKA